MRFQTELLIQLASVSAILKQGCFYSLIRTQLLLPEHLHNLYIQPRKLGGIKISHPASWPIHGLTELQIYFTQTIITFLKPSVSDPCSFTAKNVNQGFSSLIFFYWSLLVTQRTHDQLWQQYFYTAEFIYCLSADLRTLLRTLHFLIESIGLLGFNTKSRQIKAIQNVNIQ